MDNLEKRPGFSGINPASGQSDEHTVQMSPEEIELLIRENERLKQELRIRDNDILSHDQVFDSIVSGTLHLIQIGRAHV